MDYKELKNKIDFNRDNFEELNKMRLYLELELKKVIDADKKREEDLIRSKELKMQEELLNSLKSKEEKLLNELDII